jgi:predicted NUDIX family phosphoesterase
MDEQVLVVKTERMRAIQFENGFIPVSSAELQQLCQEVLFIPRSEAEKSSEYKQLIPYSILRMGERIFRYQRTRSGGESRLFQLFSIGVGGHINPEDGKVDMVDGMAMIERARLREIQEEFCCKLVGEPGLVGLINDDSNPVGQVHIGVVYEYRLESDQIVPNEAENFMEYGLVRVPELTAQMDRFETWSQIVIREYLLSSLLH